MAYEKCQTMQIANYAKFNSYQILNFASNFPTFQPSNLPTFQLFFFQSTKPLEYGSNHFCDIQTDTM